MTPEDRAVRLALRTRARLPVATRASATLVTSGMAQRHASRARRVRIIIGIIICQRKAHLVSAPLATSARALDFVCNGR